MILVTVVTDGCGKMKSVMVDGHALGLYKEGSIVCAAVSILVRTAARLLEADPGVCVSGGPGRRGEFELVIERADESKAALVRTVGDFLIQGMRDLQAEFPGDCTLKIKQRRKHGS